MDKNQLTALLSIDGLQFVPIKEGKRPAPLDWQNQKKTYSYDEAIAVGLVCGPISGNVEVIDVDLHHDATGMVLKDYKELISEQSTTLLKKLVVQKTSSGGVHFIYRCSVVEGNKKLANEQKDEKGNMPSLIETRGVGGQILVAPSPNYTFVQGSLESIPEITIDERTILWDCARALNRHIEAFSPSARKIKEMQLSTPNETPWDAYNERGDWRGLLERHGWKFVKSKGAKHHFLRPGDSKAEYSGDFHEDKNLFAVFSSSTVFEPQKGYSPFAMYAYLDHNKDFSQAARQLLKDGYGKYTAQKPVDKQSYVFTPDRPKITVGNTHEILTDRKEIEAYLDSVVNGTLEMGLKTGLDSLDQFWLLKKNYFVMVNGFDNVGKSTFMWYIGMLSAAFHGWKWAFLCMENQSGPVVKRLMEFYWSRPLNFMSALQRKQALDFVDEHFKFLSIKKGWTYMEVLEGYAALKAKHGVSAGLIDPYRSLVYDTKNDYAYHSRAGNDFKRFAQEELSIYVNIHATSSAARNYNKETNSQKAPTKADVEYGGAWTGPVDDFLTVHRLLGHPELKYQTQIFVRKIKERETGGDWTSDASPVVLKMPKGLFYTTVDGTNPMEKYHNGWHPGKFVPEGGSTSFSSGNATAHISSFETERTAPIKTRSFYEPQKEDEDPSYDKIVEIPF